MGYADIAAYFSRWIDTTASAIVSLLSSVRAGKTVQVIEEDTGSFVIQSDRAAPSGLPFERVQIIDGKLAGAHPDSIIAMLNGSRAELKLRPARVLFRPLELPQRATEFLAGVVRAADRSPDTVDRERRGLRLECAHRGGRRSRRDHRCGNRARDGAADCRRTGRGRRGGGRRHRRATRCRADHRARHIAGRARSMSRVCAAPWSPS